MTRAAGTEPVRAKSSALRGTGFSSHETRDSSPVLLTMPNTLAPSISGCALGHKIGRDLTDSIRRESPSNLLRSVRVKNQTEYVVGKNLGLGSASRSCR
jgi:hypothetical protein